MKSKYLRKSTFRLNNSCEAVPVQVVGDAAIATGSVGDGRLIPLLILWAKDRPDVEQLIQAHEHFSEGDVDVTWGFLDHGRERTILVFQFKRPVQCTCIVEFDTLRQGILIEHILASQLVYLQSGNPGDRFVTTQNAPRMLAEVPNTDFQTEWDKTFRKRVIERLKSDGVARSEAKRLASDYVDKVRSQAKFRIS